MFAERRCAICGARPCVWHVSRAITPEDAIDALLKIGAVCRSDDSYFCPKHTAAAAGAVAGRRAA